MRDWNVARDGYAIVYTDGACTRNGAYGAKAGIGVFFKDGSSLNLSEPVIGRATNNNAEIQAITRAAELADNVGIRRLRIYTDSMFVINCINKWMDKWRRNGWITFNGRSVVNRQELEEMDDALSRLTFDIQHVVAHNKNYGNEMADRLARKGAEEYEDY